MARITLLLSAFALLFSLVAASIPQSHIGTTVPHVSDKTAELSHPRIVDPSQADFPFSPSNASPEPRPMLEKRRHHRKNHSYSPVTVTNGKVTFYAGNQLLSPACPGAQNPNDGSMIAAISFDSPFQCGDKIKITQNDGKHAVVTVIDRCAGCTRNWIDVTKGVFSIFDGLDTGVLRDVTFTKL